MEKEVRNKAIQYGMSKPIQTIAVEVYDEFKAKKKQWRLYQRFII